MGHLTAGNRRSMGRGRGLRGGRRDRRDGEPTSTAAAGSSVAGGQLPERKRAPALFRRLRWPQGRSARGGCRVLRWRGGRGGRGEARGDRGGSGGGGGARESLAKFWGRKGSAREGPHVSGGPRILWRIF